MMRSETITTVVTMMMSYVCERPEFDLHYEAKHSSQKEWQH